MPEVTILSELGDRAQRHRVSMNLAQADLARNAGVSQRTLERFEAGSSIQLEKMLRILRALKLSDNLDQLIPEAAVRPIQMAGSKTEVRQRASKPRKGPAADQGWVWGDRK